MSRRRRVRSRKKTQQSKATSDDTANSEYNYKFDVNAEVLCYHGAVLYEAKILRRDIKINEQYFVHFKGWSKRYDDWIDCEDVLKKNARNIEKMKESFIKAKEMAKQSKKSKKKKDSSAMADINLEETNVSKVTIPKEFRITLGVALRRNLCEQWEKIFKDNVNRSRKKKKSEPFHLVFLPKPEGHTIEHIFDKVRNEYINKWNKASNRTNTTTTDIPTDVKIRHLNETLKGLNLYFESMIEQLLFSTESKQWSQLKAENPNLTAAQIFGAEHLVRLLHKMPIVLSSTEGLYDTHIAILKTNTGYVSQYLSRNAHTYLNAQLLPFDT